MTLPERFSDQRSQAGETLLEVIMSTALMAIVVVAVIGGISTMLFGSKINRDQANANIYLVSAMERIKSPDFPRWKCTDPSTAQAVYQTEAQKVTVPTGWTIAVTATDAADPTHPVQFQYVDTSGSAPVIKFGGTCSETTPLQLVTLTVTSSGSKVTPSLAFVKGNN
jgi:Tfp pilus assembly protein PilV